MEAPWSFRAGPQPIDGVAAAAAEAGGETDTNCGGETGERKAAEERNMRGPSPAPAGAEAAPRAEAAARAVESDEGDTRETALSAETEDKTKTEKEEGLKGGGEAWLQTGNWPESTAVVGAGETAIEVLLSLCLCPPHTVAILAYRLITAAAVSAALSLQSRLLLSK